MCHDFSWSSRYQWAGDYPEGCEIGNRLKSVEKHLQTTSNWQRFRSNIAPKRATLLPTELFHLQGGANVTTRRTICGSLPCHFRTFRPLFMRSNTHRWNQQQPAMPLARQEPQEFFPKQHPRSAVLVKSKPLLRKHGKQRREKHISCQPLLQKMYT